LPSLLEARLPEFGRQPSGDAFCLRYMSRQAGYPRVSSSLIEESVMDNISWLVPGLAGRRTARQ
jgi:hypothetical protein